MPDLSWMDRAACAGQDTELFFPDWANQAGPARWFCRRCPVRDDCLEYAVEQADLFGIWGGTSKQQRTRMRNRSIPFTAEADPESPGGVRSTGATFGPCVECGEIVSVPSCSEAGHPWTELPTDNGVVTVCLVCKDRPYAPLKETS